MTGYHAMLAACGSEEIVWVPGERVRAAGLDDDLPLWIAADDAESAGVMPVCGARAVAA